MASIYIIVTSNAYDAYEHPDDNYFLSEEEAETESKERNKGHHRDYCYVHEMTLKTK